MLFLRIFFWLKLKAWFTMLFFFCKLIRMVSSKLSFSKAHQSTLQDKLAFEAAYTDSGHWDYVVLLGADAFVRSIIIYTLAPVTEFFIIEKASKKFIEFLGAFSFETKSWNLYGIDVVFHVVIKGIVSLLVIIGLISLTFF